MDRKLVSIVLFSLQMTKSNDLPFFQLVMRSKWRHYQFNNDENICIKLFRNYWSYLYYIFPNIKMPIFRLSFILYVLLVVRKKCFSNSILSGSSTEISDKSDISPFVMTPMIFFHIFVFAHCFIWYIFRYIQYLFSTKWQQFIIVRIFFQNVLVQGCFARFQYNFNPPEVNRNLIFNIKTLYTCYLASCWTT